MPNDSAIQGSFSTMSARADCAMDGHVDSIRRIGQRSTSSSTNGNVIRIGLASMPSTNGTVTREIAEQRRPADVAEVRVERDHQRERRQHVFPLGDPRHGFHAHRVNREHGSDERASLHGAGRAIQKQEQQARADRVQRHGHQVMAARPRTEQLRVDHVRDPRDRMEVRRARRECPLEIRERHARDHVRIVEDVSRVIPGDEIECVNGPEDAEDEEGQREGNQQDPRRQRRARPWD